MSLPGAARGQRGREGAAAFGSWDAHCEARFCMRLRLPLPSGNCFTKRYACKRHSQWDSRTASRGDLPRHLPPAGTRDNLISSVAGSLGGNRCAGRARVGEAIARRQRQAQRHAEPRLAMGVPGPEAAAAFAATLAAGSAREGFISSLASSLEQRRPEGAMTGSTRCPAECAAQALQNMLGNLSYQDPETAAQLLQSVAPARCRVTPTDKSPASGRSLIRQGARLGANPATRSRKRRLANLVQGLAQKIPSAPRSDRQFSAGPIAQPGDPSLASIWASSDVTGAVEWVKNLRKAPRRTARCKA